MKKNKIMKIQKRDGRVVDFDKNKITEAIWKAAKAVGGKDKKLAEKLSIKVLDFLEKEFKNKIPAVEQVQDVVEKVLIENGHARTAKAYILYRQKRTELRNEKKRILEKEDTDEVDKQFDLNALRVLKSRYLRKSENGKLIEDPKKLFTRVAVHTFLPEIFYDLRVFNKEGEEKPFPIEEFNPVEFEDFYSIGKYKLNKYHLEALKRMYDRTNRNGKVKVSFDKLLKMIESGEFDEHEKTIDTFFNILVSRKFMANTPAVANFGGPLGMGSACLHPNQLILTIGGPKKISEIQIGEMVLTHRGRFRKVRQLFVRNANSLLSFECKKLPKPTMLVTDEHPILAFKDGEIGWYPAYMIKESDHVALSYPAEIKNIEKIKVSEGVDGVTIKDDKCFYEYKGGKFNAFVHTTKYVKNTIEVDYDLMKLFGFYLSEGNVSEGECVRFTLSTDELDYCNEIISIMENKFGVTARVESNSNPERKWLSLRFHSTILAKFFENLFGTGYDKKRIPNWIMLLPAEKQKGMMSGMIKGDGTLFKNWNKMNARLVMSNPNLVYSFWQMCMRCNVFTALGKESMPKLGNTQPVRCTLGDAKGQLLMNELFGETIQESIGVDKTLVVNGIVFTDVEKIEKIDYNGDVYNLEVEEDHSYVANMVSVHNCFVLGVDDSIDSIMDSLKAAAIIFKSGGGLGYNFSKLRPEGDFVSTTSGVASGPITFMQLFDKMTEVIKQGGIRRGANMGILNSNHPDIEKFVKAKEGNKALRNFNISVLIMPDFWEYYEKNEPYPLINPRNGQIVRTINPRLLFDMIVYQAWESAEPGVIFFDTVNKFNPFLKSLGPIVTTNPCGEVVLYPYESCNLGSINVWAFAREDEEGNTFFDWDGLRDAILISTRFLDNVIDVNNYPLREIEEITLSTRKIGLGVMGLGDLLYELKIPYNSEEGRKFMEVLMEFVNYWSKVESIELAKERGPMPYFDKSFYFDGRLPFAGFEDRSSWHFNWDEIVEKIKNFGIRNGYTTIIAPTGSISMITSCSSGMEPVYSLVFEKNVAVGSFFYIDPVFEKVMRSEGLYDEDLMKAIAENRGSIQNIPYIPPEMKKTFVIAMDITPEDHIRALAAFQRWTDSSISKTNNFPADATVEDMKASYLLAYKLGCKDVTVFRDTSIKNQVLVVPKKKEEPIPEEIPAANLLTQTLVADGNGIDLMQQRGVCPNCNILLTKKEGCVSCIGCGWGYCLSA